MGKTKIIPSSKSSSPQVVAVVGFIVVVGLLIAFGTAADGQTSALRKGAALADFSLQDLDGQAVRLSDYAGQTVLINAWASWCPPCTAEMPTLQAYYAAHQADQFVVLAINAGESRQVAAQFASQAGLTFPILLDPGASLLGQLGIQNFPTSVLIGRDGTIKAVHIGLMTPEALARTVDPHLQ